MYFDTHAHLDQDEFSADRDEVLARARRVGVEGIVCVGVSAATSQSAVRLAEAYLEIRAAVGIQPNSCAEAAPRDWDRVVAMLDHPRAVAVGETGLDRYWDTSRFELQQDYFARHLALAQERDLPVIIHCRDAQEDVLAMLREAAGRGPLRGVLHAFSGDEAMAAECLAMGLYISFAGNVTYTNKKFQPLRAVAATIPDERIVIETDSPYLVPHPLRGKQPRNEPALITHTAACLAGLRGTTAEAFATQTTANARRLFRIE